MRIYFLNQDRSEKFEIKDIITNILIENDDGSRFFECAMVSALLLKLLGTHAPIEPLLDIKIN